MAIGTTMMTTTTFAAVSGSISGDTYCTYGSYNNTVGVWVDASSGTDGWASWYSIDSAGDAHWSYSLSQSTSSYTLHIGCGGTSSHWAHTFYMYNLTTSGTSVYCTVSDGCVLG